MPTTSRRFLILKEFVKQHNLSSRSSSPFILNRWPSIRRSLRTWRISPDGSRIAVPSDPTNEGRALKVLENAGLIKLKKDATLLATTVDIVENPKKLSFYELEPAQLPRSLDDVAAAVINANLCTSAGLNPAHDSIALEA